MNWFPLKWALAIAVAIALTAATWLTFREDGSFSIARHDTVASPVSGSGDRRTANDDYSPNASVLANATTVTNIEAASEAFQNAMTCAKFKRLSAGFGNQRSGASSVTNSEVGVQSLSAAELEAIARNLEYVRVNTEMCERISLLPQDTYAAALNAAQHGDRDAAACFVLALWPLPEQLSTDPVFLRTYRENSLKFIDQGIKAGDWRMVTLMIMANGNPYGPMATLLRPDPIEAYRYTKVKRLGMQGNEAEIVDRQLKAMAEGRSPNEIVRSDLWAERLYTQYFSGKGPYSDTFGNCEI